ncbi:MAG TPA: methylmalonyl-CoA epimerase [bacterium]|nr:methylmalonyl-CoA epimerase [bacterium]
MSSGWRPSRIDHIGVAVRSIAEASRLYETLGLSVGVPEVLPRDGVTAAFVTVGTVRIELLQPSGSEGPIARFLARRGEGIHHIALAVDDIAEALEHARHAGFTLIDEVPRAGAHDSRIVFLHPKDTHGVLIELVQTA